MIKNQLKTAILLGLLTGLFLLIGALIGGRTGLIIGLLLAVTMNFLTYWFSARMVLWIYRAKEADKKKHADLYAMVKELAVAARLPQPKVYIVDTPHANAFATGRDYNHAVIAVTTGILNLLSAAELRGVLSHELSHVKNRDILISSIAATIAGVISYVAMMARWSALLGGFGGNDDNRGMGIVELLVLGIIAPLMAMIIQLAISRSREYLADESGAKLGKDPLALASALEKIHRHAAAVPLRVMGTTEATAHLFIENPFKGGAFLNLFSTHPPMEKRVQRLKAMKV